MILWELRGQEGRFNVYLPDESLTSATHRRGINPVAVRQAISDAGVPEVLFQVVAPDGLTTLKERAELTDFLLWSWVPIFSERAKALAVEQGCHVAEFQPCRFESNPGEEFFMHLPTVSIDIVDVSRSKFVMVIPSNPPLPHGIELLALRTLESDLPPCFRALIPGHEQVFSELIVSEQFKQAWERTKCTGGDFRLLT